MFALLLAVSNGGGGGTVIPIKHERGGLKAPKPETLNPKP